MKFHIFDLDHTVIDSSHRQRLLPNGDLDLAHWIANRADRSLVMRDRLLPLASYWRTVQETGQPIAICTSRVITSLEHEFLAKHDLRADHFMHREEHDTRSDAPYKVAKIGEHFAATGWTPEHTTLYDDHPGVRRAVREAFGVRTFNPIPFNRQAYR